MFPRLKIWCICIGIIALVPGIPPDLEFESFSVNPSDYGATLIKDKLNNAERLFENQLVAPEHLQVHDDELYFTAKNGLFKLENNDSLFNVYRINESCGRTICGQPLGFTFGANGQVYLMDAHNGIIKINPETGESESLVSMNDAIEGKIPMLPNSVITSRETGKIYWSDSSTELHLDQLLFLALGNGKGRLIEYDPEKKITRVLIQNLHFANGVMLAEDESFVMVAETFKGRILRYYLKGDKAGLTDVFIDNLPGWVDNINKLESDLFAVTIFGKVPPLINFLNSFGTLRKIIVRQLSILQLTIKQVSHWFPSLKILDYLISSYELADALVSGDKSATSVVFNSAGQIKEILRCTDGSITAITSTTELNGYYYLGSFVNPYLARVKIPVSE